MRIKRSPRLMPHSPKARAFKGVCSHTERNRGICLHVYLINSRYTGVTNNIKYLKFVLHTEPIIII